MFSEQRQSVRKVLKTKALFAGDGAAPVTVRTLDIGANGMSIELPGPLQAGQGADLAFELFVEGKLCPIKVRAKVAYCLLSNGEFKVGLQFLNLDLASMTMLAKFLR